MRPNRPDAKSSNEAGYTLVEMMFVAAISVTLAIGVTGFMIEVGEGFFWASNKSMITADVRLFTAEIASEARACNSAYVYPSFAASDRDELADRRQGGQTGDCLVLVNVEPYPDADDSYHVTDIIVYFRRPDASDATGPVYRLEHNFSEANYVNTALAGFSLENTLATIAPTDAGNYPVVVELSRGLADGRLFMNENEGRLIVVNGEILHGNTVKEITNTYNLSISPRG